MASAAVGVAVAYSLVDVAPIVCGGLVVGPCFDLQYFVSFQVLQSSLFGRESWLLYLCCVCGCWIPLVSF